MNATKELSPVKPQQVLPSQKSDHILIKLASLYFTWPIIKEKKNKAQPNNINSYPRESKRA